MASFAPVVGTKTEIQNTPIVNGQFLMETDQGNSNKCYVDHDNTRSAVGGSDISEVTAPTTGTASQTTFARQTLTVNNSIHTEINGTKYMEYSQALSTSVNTDYTFLNVAITTNSVIEVFVDIFGINPINISVPQNGQCIVTFPPQNTANNMTCRIYIR